MRVTWIGGQLDGCVDEIERPSATWIGPDVGDPENKVIVYVLKTKHGKANDCDYHFDQRLTDHANEFPGEMTTES